MIYSYEYKFFYTILEKKFGVSYFLLMSGLNLTIFPLYLLFYKKKKILSNIFLHLPKKYLFRIADYS